MKQKKIVHKIEHVYFASGLAYFVWAVIFLLLLETSE